MQPGSPQASLLQRLEGSIAMAMFYNESSFSFELADTEKEIMDLIP